MVLRRLEPLFLKPGEYILRENEEANKITFLMKARETSDENDELASIDIGYNHHAFLGQHYILSKDFQGASQMLADMQRFRIARMHYPMKTRSFPIGAFEIMLNHYTS